MPYCDGCNQEISHNEAHTFAGWGFYVLYHSACCPHVVDGWECNKDHPLGEVCELFDLLNEEEQARAAKAYEQCVGPDGPAKYLGTMTRGVRRRVLGMFAAGRLHSRGCWVDAEDVRLLTPQEKRRPPVLIPDVVGRFADYLDGHGAWGSLHVVLDDGNLRDDDVLFCRGWAHERGDAEGEALAWILWFMSRSQRGRLDRKVREHQRREAEAS